MTKNPFINALSATLYIFGIANVMFYASQHGPRGDTVFIPIAVVSLFTLSAAVMGYFFLYQPVQMYFDGKKKAAAKLFLQTLGIFAATTAIILALLFTGVLA